MLNTFVSTEGRALMAKMPASVERTWELALAVDNALLDHKISKWLAFNSTTALAIHHLLALKDKAPTRADAPKLDLRAYDNAYKYVCERYLQRDLDRPNAVRVAQICARYTFHKIVRVTKEIAGRSHAPAFLDAALASAPDDELEDQRRDTAIEELLAQSSAPLVVPPKRFPGLMSGAMQRARVDEQVNRLIERTLYGLEEAA